MAWQKQDVRKKGGGEGGAEAPFPKGEKGYCLDLTAGFTI